MFYPHICTKPHKFRLNTLLSDESLMAMANKIYNDEHSLELEKGTSFLYLSLGFLKWKDNITDGNEFCSPLFSIPVKIIKNRVRGSFVFYLQKGADDVTEWYVENGDTRTLANLQVLQSKLNHPRQ